MSWVPEGPDMTADWADVADWLVGTCKAMGKTVAGQEMRPSSVRAGREVVLERLRGSDTGKQRKGPSVNWLWTATLVLSYPGRLKDGTHRTALADAQAIADVLTTGDPERGWRIHVSDAETSLDSPDTLRVRLTVTIDTYWRHGQTQGTELTSAEALANEGLT